MAKKYIKIDSQILSAYAKCNRYFEQAFIKNLRLIESKFSIERGSLCHDVLKYFYESLKAGKSKSISRSEALDFGRSRISKYKSIDIPRGIEVIETMQSYFEYYASERWIPIDVEKIHKKVIFEDEDIAILYVAKIDVTVAGEPEINIMPVDHKSYDRWFDSLILDDQFTGYANILNVNYIVVNKIGFQKSYPPDKKFRRIKLVYSREKREEWVHNTVRLVRDMIFDMENNSFPMRRSQCGMYGGCDHKPICEMDYRARDGVIEKLYEVREAWDPEKLDK